MQPSTEPKLEVELEVPVLIQVGHLEPTEIGTISMPCTDPVVALAGLLREVVARLDQGDFVLRS